MRYLNKIVFLNSAHIPYAEVKLDGNVHFIGTQGVGKSTLLRALLFFYNADKLRLGIPKEKKSFDAFYFPYANSYIIYEVMRENGAYCVVAAKSQGRVFFRFVDAPFCRDWFINDRNEVRGEWGRIRECIGGKCQITPQVTSYEMYRDIIFGNNRKQEMVPYRKFAIVESAKYQNIPRTIQNVFLNSKLDADFIKDTIIRSMSDEDASVDLDFYRSQIKEFEQEYTDVMLWFTKNKNGEIPVRKMAEKVINAYRDLLYTHRQIKEGRAELNFAEKLSQQEIPRLKEKISQSTADKERFVRLTEELKQKYEKERDVLIAQMGGIDTLLRQIRDKRQYYEQVRIEEVVKRVAREDMLTQELERAKEMKLQLTQAYDDVLSKYRTLFDSLEAGVREMENSRQARILQKRTEMMGKKEQLMSELRVEEEKVRTLYEEKFRLADDRLVRLRDEQAAEKQRQLKISYENPYQKETDECAEGIEELKKRSGELELQIRGRQMDVDRLRQECERKQKELEWESQQKTEVARKEKADIEKQLQTLEGLIESRKGSFCEWLEQHSPGWQETVGKVVDEETVLYSRELHPQRKDDSHTLFGISVDLSSIERAIRTPEELKQEWEERKKACEVCVRRLTHLTEEQNEAVAGLQKKYSKQIREITQQLHLLEAEHLQLPHKLKNAQADYAGWRTKTEVWRRERTEEIQSRQNEIAHRLYVADEEKKKLITDREKQLKACRKVFKDAEAALQSDLNRFIAEAEREIASQKQQAEERRKELKQAQDAELSGKGADVNAIGKYDGRIAELKKELDYIREHRSLVSDYEKDKRELFEEEPAMRNRKKEAEAKHSALDERFASRREKLQTQIKGEQDKLDRMVRELKVQENGLEKATAFRKDDTFCPPGSMEVGERATRKSCECIVEELKSLIVSSIKKLEEFKKAVTQFNGNFSSKNTFHFRTELISEEDYYDFASNLCEFVDNDKIADYQKRISERYTDLIRRISKEVGDLTRNESEIHRTIGDINDDFAKRNFAGVIKEILLRPLHSSDRLMQLLLEIKKFTDENQYNMGEVDLFSQSSRDEVNATAVRYLLSFMKFLLDDPGRKRLVLADTFKLEFRVKENDNDTGWVEKIANVGSDGTDILVKAMVNIMLINVFKEKASRKFGDFKIHCMMDEIGKLHPNNVKGILEFANCRNILLVNSSPTTYNVEDYRYTYLLSKDGKSNTQVVPLLSKV